MIPRSQKSFISSSQRSFPSSPSRFSTLTRSNKSSVSAQSGKSENRLQSDRVHNELRQMSENLKARQVALSRFKAQVSAAIRYDKSESKRRTDRSRSQALKSGKSESRIQMERVQAEREDKTAEASARMAGLARLQAHVAQVKKSIKASPDALRRKAMQTRERKRIDAYLQARGLPLNRWIYNDD